MKIKSVFITVLSFIVFAGPAYPQDLAAGKDGSVKNQDTRDIIIGKELSYLATRNELYRTDDAYEGWKSIFFLPRGENEITSLAGDSKAIFIGTKRGLFRSLDYGANWRNVFKTIIPEKNDILCVETSKYNPKELLIGTRRGVFMTEDSGDTWRDLSTNIKNASIKCVALDSEAIYAGTSSGLYIRKGGSDGWERLVVKTAPEGGSEAIDEEGPLDISCIARSDKRLYVANGKNVLYSDDGGKTFRDFERNGLTGAVRFILPSVKSEKLYSATTKGIFEFDKDKSRWIELYKGMDKALSVERLAFAAPDEKSIWAVTENGLYRIEAARYVTDGYPDIEKSLRTLRVTFSSEPRFEELQQAAMRFADVSPDKIKNWQRESRLRAFLPKVSFGIDNKRSTNSEIYTSATRDYVIAGPDDINSGLGVDISWELGDLIWSDDQTNIDVRSRLTTQLRNDILDDLRRVYYERRRVQFELMTYPPKDLKARFEKEMRLAELTQAIDDLTGNYFSDNVSKD